jgi:ComF family protein
MFCNKVMQEVKMPTLIEQIISTIAPHYCTQCGAEGNPLCDHCAVQVFTQKPAACAFCGRLTANAQVCVSCSAQTPLRQVWCLGEYDGLLEELIHDLKFFRKQAVADIFAKQLAAQLPFFDKETIVTWLPTAPARVRQRGYDQAAVIAQTFAQARNLNCRALLQRCHNLRQVGATKAQRQQSAAVAYAIQRLPKDTPPILLIDDVMTTGASLTSAATLLHEKGFTNLMAAVVAKQSLKR